MLIDLLTKDKERTWVLGPVLPHRTHFRNMSCSSCSNNNRLNHLQTKKKPNLPFFRRQIRPQPHTAVVTSGRRAIPRHMSFSLARVALCLLSPLLAALFGPIIMREHRGVKQEGCLGERYRHNTHRSSNSPEVHCSALNNEHIFNLDKLLFVNTVYCTRYKSLLY